MNLLAGSLTMVLCLWLQLLSLHHALSITHLDDTVAKPRRFLALVRLMLLLATVAIAQMALWAGLYRVLGEFGSFEEALYFSGVTFTSLGYGDLTLSPASRLLAPIEALVGLLMLGISTALFSGALQQAMLNRRKQQP